MKQLIFSILLIFFLIAFFVIVDGSAFSRYNEVQTVQIESTTTNRKPNISNPQTKPVTVGKLTVEAEPAETSPVVEVTRMADPKPVTDVKPKTDIIKSVEAKLGEGSQNDDTSIIIPVAVEEGIITAEEVIKANEGALSLHSKEETIADTKDKRIVAESQTEDRTVPMAVPVLTREEAIKANKAALRSYRNKAIGKAVQAFIIKIGLNNNRIHFILSLLPLLFIIDAISLKRKESKRGKVNQYFSLSRRMRILLSVSLLSFGLMVFVPWSVYFGNSLQFPFIFQDFVNWNLRVLTISIVGGSIVLLLIPPIISDYLVAITTGLGLCVYVQAMFMNQYLGTMDGTEPEWNKHLLFGTINIIIWIAIVLSPVIVRKVAPSYFSKVISIVTGIVLFIELLATASMVCSANQNVWSRTADTYYIDGSKQFQLSKEKNVVVFIMDALGSGCTQKCFEFYPEDKEIVKDFIWYADARSNYSDTFPGILNELTGSFLVVPGKNYYDIIYKTWHSLSAKSFYKQIKDAGYDARFYIKKTKDMIGPEEYYHEYFTNVVGADIKYKIDYNRLHFCLKQITGFSSLPFFIKKQFFYSFDFSDNVVQKIVLDNTSYQKQIFNSNQEVLKKMTSSGITSSADKPILSFHYMLGAHRPFNYDEKCNKVDVPFNNAIPPTRGCFYFISEFIRLLKEAGIYDETAIFVLADHGGRGEYATPYDMMFMVKPFHENKTELTIDNSRVQSIDVLPSLLKIACGDDADFKDFEGYPSSSVPKERERIVHWLVKDNDFSDFDGWKSYNCFYEYNFVDAESFQYSENSKYFIRKIPLGMTSQGN